MTPILELVTAARWQALGRLAEQPALPDGTRLDAGSKLCLDYLRVPPYAANTATASLHDLAEIDTLAAASLALYRISLCSAYRHIVCRDLSKARDQALAAVIFLHEGLCRLRLVSTELDQDTLTLSHRLVNCLASQYDLHDALIRKRFPPHLVFVLGMHRSGTSALAGLLAQAGFSAPQDLMPATPANPKGYWESLAIYAANQNLLASINSHWSSSMPVASEWIYSDSAREWRSKLADALAVSFADADLPIIKDPRFCLLLAGLEPWFQSGLIDCAFLIPIRHPFEVANSLQESEKLGHVEALRLWSQSIFLSDLATQAYPRLYLGFDAIIDSPDQVLDACLGFVKASLPGCRLPDRRDVPAAGSGNGGDAVSGFINPSLRRQRPVLRPNQLPLASHNVSLSRLADFAQATYGALLTAIEDPDQVSRVLAARRAELNYALL
jgi:hypothetical protein